MQNKWRPDVSASNFIADSKAHRREITRALDDFRPDVIALEQCWLWPVIRDYIETAGAHGGFSIVYSSQNVEQDLLAQEAILSGKDADEWNVRRAAEIELDLLAQADLVVAVSEQDAACFSKRNSSVVVAPNGIWQRDKPTGLDRWASRFSGLRTALFVGSAHPPNASGFLAMTAPDLGFLSPTERILVVGGVADLIRGDERFLRCADLNNARIELLGVQDGGTLSALIELADVVMLPIAEGGGTNIKTAEALYNRKRIVATPFAFRGYERFAHDQNVELADHPEHFQDLLAKALRGKSMQIEPTHAGQLESLLWTATLRNLPEQFAALPRHRRRAPTGWRLSRPVDGSRRFLRALSRRLGLREKS
ncbi:glycosyltransferase [Mesorhizobium carmichaelinearum]|uniref:glycosyltransferase n=1 Tax=Mesorhizobium carmichaelinearum TaxID=1208188 RepID=UPI001FCE5181|nr:glycosyltransferase [Mesorhizobium carmichaelinearum]